MKKTKTPPPIVEGEKDKAEQARQLILQERANRREICMKEIDGILKKYRCRIEPVIILRNNQVIAQNDVIPLD